MFHIKTDIRQYKCESTEKVEQLIRNWVIRPSDLIYNATDKSWKPIGQHPAFDDIFAGIEHEEANEPDTVVTEAPSEVAAKHEVEPGSELEANGVGPQETTNVSPAPSRPDAPSPPHKVNGEVVGSPSVVVDAGDATLAADSEEITNVTEAPKAPEPGEVETADVRQESEAVDEEITDVREDPRRDTDEHDATDTPEPVPPEPSDEVEGLVRDSDEITMMTGKTFEMLSEESGKEASKAGASEAEAATPDALADEEGAAPEDDAQDDDEALTENASEGVDEEPGEAESDDEEESDDSSGGGRHGLPEEVFVTDEIPRQSVQQAVLDELGELEEEPESTEEDDEVTEILDRDGDADVDADADSDNEERKSRWRIVMSDDPDEEAHEEQSAAADAPVDTAEAEAGDEDEQLEEAAGNVEAQPEESSDGDDDLDDMLDEAAELVGLGEGSDPVDIDVDVLEPLGEDEEGEDGEEDEGRKRADTPVRAVVEPEEFVSEGYKLPLPVDISPSREDIRLGLAHSRVGKLVKDATFPYPKPKKRDEIATRRYDLDPEEPADHSVMIVAAFLIGLLIIVLGAVTIFG